MASTERVFLNESVLVEGEEFLLNPARVIIWPRLRLLVVADLHLGKAQTFHNSGFWLPPDAHSSDLFRLTLLCSRFDISHVLFLGDFVHARVGVTNSIVEEFVNWKSYFHGEVTVVVGNHDRGTVKRWPKKWRFAKLVDEWSHDQFVFRHEPPERELLNSTNAFFWCGHVHPKVSMKRGPERLYLPAFLITDRVGYLPAYSSLAGGSYFKVTRSSQAKSKFFAITAERVIPI